MLIIFQRIPESLLSELVPIRELKETEDILVYDSSTNRLYRAFFSFERAVELARRYGGVIAL